MAPGPAPGGSSSLPCPRYREELPAHIRARAEKHVTLPELERLLAWKLAVRGRPGGGASGSRAYAHLGRAGRGGAYEAGPIASWLASRGGASLSRAFAHLGRA